MNHRERLLERLRRTTLGLTYEQIAGSGMTNGKTLRDLCYDGLVESFFDEVNGPFENGRPVPLYRAKVQR